MHDGGLVGFLQAVEGLGSFSAAVSISYQLVIAMFRVCALSGALFAHSLFPTLLRVRVASWQCVPVPTTIAEVQLRAQNFPASHVPLRACFQITDKLIHSGCRLDSAVNAHTYNARIVPTLSRVAQFIVIALTAQFGTTGAPLSSVLAWLAVDCRRGVGHANIHPMQIADQAILQRMTESTLLALPGRLLLVARTSACARLAQWATRLASMRIATAAGVWPCVFGCDSELGDILHYLEGSSLLWGLAKPLPRLRSMSLSARKPPGITLSVCLPVLKPLQRATTRSRLPWWWLSWRRSLDGLPSGGERAIADRTIWFIFLFGEEIALKDQGAPVEAPSTAEQPPPLACWDWMPDREFGNHFGPSTPGAPSAAPTALLADADREDRTATQCVAYETEWAEHVDIEIFEMGLPIADLPAGLQPDVPAPPHDDKAAETLREYIYAAESVLHATTVPHYTCDSMADSSELSVERFPGLFDLTNLQQISLVQSDLPDALRALGLSALALQFLGGVLSKGLRVRRRLVGWESAPLGSVSWVRRLRELEAGGTNAGRKGVASLRKRLEPGVITDIGLLSPKGVRAGRLLGGGGADDDDAGRAPSAEEDYASDEAEDPNDEREALAPWGRAAPAGAAQAPAARLLQRAGVLGAALALAGCAWWGPRARRAAGGAASPAEAVEVVGLAVDECEDAAEGSPCYASVAWVMQTGIYEHPEWFEGLDKEARFEEVQAKLAEDDPSKEEDQKSHCKAPCRDPSAVKRHRGIPGSALDLPVPGPYAERQELEFYMYRAQSDHDYPMENVDTADLAGVMWYLHNEIVVAVGRTRKYGVTRIRRFKVKMRTTWAYYNSHRRQFGSFVAFDSGHCTVPDCDRIWMRFGALPGCQHVDTQRERAAYMSDVKTYIGDDCEGYQCRPPVWYSLPGSCPNHNNEEKTPECIRDLPGGLCDAATGDRSATTKGAAAGVARPPGATTSQRRARAASAWRRP
ncbi:unnamed protein product [Prorocentrum cordatum]|uniref:Uncharacterized protein n=1 Tax=Prorocentrum cordatum TaxID=2364126 RepID=A0ABN9XZS6_9DINO|nr:unnamed protein product [Polarella glacialis]